MAGEARFLQKNVIAGEGIVANPSSAVVRESDNAWNLIGGARIGDGPTMQVLMSVVVLSQDFAAIQPTGSTGAQAINMALSGVGVGDLCFAGPTQSVPLGIVWAAACYSAGVVNVRALHTQSGNVDLASTHWRVAAIKFG